MNWDTVFLIPFNRAVAAGWLILAVILLRLVFTRAPKQLRIWLWGIVGLRLVSPVSVQSVFSLIPSTDTVTEDFLYEAIPSVQSNVPVLDRMVNTALQQSGSLTPQQPVSANPAQILCYIAGVLWVVGMAGLFLYSVASFIALKLRLRYAVRRRENIYECEKVSVPFVFGVFKSRIYLPFGLNESVLEHVIAHEYAHIHRRDPLVKLIGWLIACIFWFYPPVWIAYALFCRDIELACDENVLRRMDSADKKAYSQALLEQSLKRNRPAQGFCPLAFGEGDIRQRIRSIIRYRKPAVWVGCICAVLCLVVAVCFLTDPVASPDPAKVVAPYDASALGGDFLKSGNATYAVGANAYGMPVFKDHCAAYSAFLRDYSDGIEVIRQAWKLDPISKKSYPMYKTYGWQTSCADAELNHQCYQVTLFFDLYENSFQKAPASLAPPTQPMEMDTDLSQEAAQLPQVLNAFPIAENGGSKSWSPVEAVQFIPEGAVCLDVSAIGKTLYIDYHHNGYRYIMAYSQDGTVEATISEYGAWSPGGMPIWIVNSTAPGKVKHLNATVEYMVQNYTGGEFLGMSMGLSYMPKDGSFYESIRLCGDRLTVISSEGEVLYDGITPTVSSYSHGALLSLLSEEWTGIPETEIPVYKNANEMAVYSWYREGEPEYPAYSIWCFHDKPVWFAERDMLRIYKLESVR